MKSIRSLAAFTLTETAVAVAICSVLMVGVMSFYIATTKGSYTSAQRLALGYDLRKFSDELLVHASRANEAILYTSALSTDRDQKSDRLEIDPTNLTRPAGDFLLFVYFDIPKPAGQPYHGVKRLEGYFLDLTAGQIHKLKRVVMDFSAAPAQLNPNATPAVTIETLLANNWTTTAVFSEFVLNVRGLSYSEQIVNTDPLYIPRIFFKNDSRAIGVAGQIYQANGNALTNDWKTYTQSFNFIITPRS